MKKVKFFLTEYPFIAIPLLYVLATFFMDISMYLFMGLSFPPRYYFSLLVLASICGVMFFLRKPSIQLATGVFLLAIHFIVAVSNIILFRDMHEITSLESLSAARQVVSLSDLITLDFDYMFVFSLILFLFVVSGGLVITLLYSGRKDRTGFRPHYRRNASFAIAILALTAYSTSLLYNFTLPKINEDASDAYANYINEKFVYSTFSNRLKVLQEFGTYSYYWSNLSFAMGFKTDFTYEIEDNWVDTFTFSGAPFYETDENNKWYDVYRPQSQYENVIMIQMETLEKALINPIIMPRLWNFLFEDEATSKLTLGVDGYYSVDRTCMAEFSALAGVHLDGIEMNTMPYTLSPYSLPHILSRWREYESVKGFHNFYDFFYNRNKFFTNGLGFQEFIAYKDMEHPEKPPINEIFNKNSDLIMFESQIEQIAPESGSFFSFIENLSTHMPYYGNNLRDTYANHFKYFEEDYFDQDNQITNLEALYDLFGNLTSSDPADREACKNYIIGAYEFDLGLGVLFDRLQNTFALNSDGEKIPNGNGGFLKLIDTTTVVLYSDHHNYVNPNLLISPENKAANKTALKQGNELACYIYSPLFNQECTREGIYNGKLFGKSTAEEIENGIYRIQTIEKFITPYDIYATICDILHIKINTKYTLGISIFDSENENIGFSTRTALIFNNEFATFDFKNFYDYNIPTDEKIEKAKNRVSYLIAVMNNMRPQYRNDTVRDIVEAQYH